MLTLVMVSFLVVTAATGIGFFAWLYDLRAPRKIAASPDLCESDA